MVMEESQTRTEQKGGEQFQTHDDNGLFPLTLSCDARMRAAYMYTWKEKCDTVSIDGNTRSHCSVNSIKSISVSQNQHQLPKAKQQFITITHVLFLLGIHLLEEIRPLRIHQRLISS